MKVRNRIILSFLLLFFAIEGTTAQETMTNVYGRNIEFLNGKWNAIVDMYSIGRPMGIFMNKKPANKTEYYEYSFDNHNYLNVPSDWNSQMPELKYYEGTVWYARHFTTHYKQNERLFLYFGAVNYRCRVYLNGKEIGEHEGGFTPFQFEITDKVNNNDSDNFIAVEVNNNRSVDAIPGMSYDWWNYGGITRDVMLVYTPRNYIKDYYIQLDKYRPDIIHADVSLSDKKSNQKVQIQIPELNVKQYLVTDNTGKGKLSFKVRNLQRWSPQSPKLYKVIVSSGYDNVIEQIGFRNLYVEGENIYLNGKPIFFKSVSFHEEIPQRKGRAFSEADAAMLLSEAKALGVNIVRLAHYPQNEYILRLAEKMGIMLWEEIPVWQKIDFANQETFGKASSMLKEMISRDKNRCALSVWGVANETRPSAARDKFVKSLIDTCHSIDPVRLVTAASDLVNFDKDAQKFELKDTIINQLDIVAVNKYMGWYHPWPMSPDKVRWNVALGKPVVISEFGCEALYGKTGDADVKSSWSEDFQANVYKDNLKMFSHITNLRGVSPWVLFDFRSPYRFNPNQSEWNRKGLVSDQGMRKKAWYIMHDYYQSIK